MAYMRWKPYVPVAQRRAKADREMRKLRKDGMQVEPIAIEGRKIARSFWGKAWCEHLEQLGDYANRLPRGRTYVRNGSVCHLEVAPGRVEAIVSGSELYHVEVEIRPLSRRKWKDLRQRCAGQIGTMLELLQGRLSEQVMQVVTDPVDGLFPQSKEIQLRCDCPDWAVMCKHVAAVLYGIGARLDDRAELLFLLRSVDHQELIATELDLNAATSRQGRRRRLSGQDLGEVFGVDLDDSPVPPPGRRVAIPSAGAPSGARQTRSVAATRTAATKKAATKKAATKKAGAKARPGGPTVAPKRASTRKVASDKAPIGEVATKSAARASRATPSRPPDRRPLMPTAAAVGRLRRRLGMSRGQLARLLGVSPTAVANWEKASGRLNLQARTLEALTGAVNLSPTEAWRILDNGPGSPLR